MTRVLSLWGTQEQAEQRLQMSKTNGCFTFQNLLQKPAVVKSAGHSAGLKSGAFLLGAIVRKTQLTPRTQNPKKFAEVINNPAQFARQA